MTPGRLKTATTASTDLRDGHGNHKRAQGRPQRAQDTQEDATGAQDSPMTAQLRSMRAPRKVKTKGVPCDRTLLLLLLLLQLFLGTAPRRTQVCPQQSVGQGARLRTLQPQSSPLGGHRAARQLHGAEMRLQRAGRLGRQTDGTSGAGRIQRKTAHRNKQKLQLIKFSQLCDSIEGLVVLIQTLS